MACPRAKVHHFELVLHCGLASSLREADILVAAKHCDMVGLISTTVIHLWAQSDHTAT